MNSAEMAKSYWAEKSMPAVGITQQAEIGKVADILKMLEVPVPRPEKDQVAVRLCASAMHLDEIYATQGTALGRFYGPKNVTESNPFVLGSSVSGVIVAIGSEVEGLKIGDEVVAIPSEHMEVASWARYRCLGQKWVMKKPEKLSHKETAAVTMAACVAWGSIGFAGVKRGDNCVVVGASGSIGVMTLQYLKSLGCHVTAVCSGSNVAFVLEYGADEVVDYTISDFGDEAVANNMQYQAVFDCVGGRAIEASAFKCLKSTGVFETVVGPMQYIGESKLSWPSFLGVMWHIVWRMLSTRLRRGPRYTFGEKDPRIVIRDAMDRLLKHNIRMPIQKSVPFEIEAIRAAVKSLSTHRSKGRTVIEFPN